ncbi:ABC transporter substrate-binding protein [Bradyrhizobium elkanii]|uniref:ABC transporter substrate-binding protein n=1 Tax=Bradyrhizobium elkanii TaxID=29448 RepID=UPI0005C15E1E|nr:ABC transporter substrate-binding protein [Bradyrhizobium elkanii]KIU48725.1 ABC transporter substrate-binding protein [Bradyrhizobium elkanii]
MTGSAFGKIVACLAVVGVSLTSLQATAGPDDRVVVAQGVYPVSFDPHRDVTIPTINVNANIYDALLTRDADLKIIPALAVSQNRISDTVLELKLRKNVVFQNGEPFDAKDVKFSLDRVLNKDERSPQRGWINTVSSVDIVDNYTIRLTTTVPDPVLPARLTLINIVSKNYFEKVGNEGLAANPIGTGPYKVGKWVRGDYLDLDANEKYWGDVPQVKKARFRAIPDVAARIAALQAKNVDIITNLPPDYVAPIRKTAGLEVATVPSARVLFLGLVNTVPGPLQDLRVRQAINHAVNVDEIVKSLLLGYGIRAGDVNGHLLRLLGVDFKSKLYDYDPKKAKQLLTEAGFPNGFGIDMDTPNGRYLMDRDISQIIAAQLGEVGIKVNLKVHEWGNYAQMFTTHKVSPIYMLGWSLPSMDPDQWATPQFGADEPVSNFDDKEIQELVVAARQEMDADKRIKLYEKLNNVVHDKAAWLFLHQQIDLYGINAKLDWKPRADESLRLSDIKLR